MAASIWPAVHTERQSLADDLKSLTDEQWNAPSLCTGWTIRDVLSHMTATAGLSPGGFFIKMISSGFSLKRMQAKDLAAARRGSSAEVLAKFNAIVNSSKHPPGPSPTWLGETIVHAEDIRRAVGINHNYQTDAVVRVADFYKGSNLVIGAKKRIAGVKLQATDTTWSHGEGPEVSGPIMSLVIAMTGRKAALADLSGPGVATLQGR
jgi:uncharacterized protein (TIGR03083 family)